MYLPVISIFACYANPLIYYWYQYGKTNNKQKQIKLRNKFRFWVRPAKADLNIVNEVFIEQQYQLIKKFHHGSSVMIDIGGHIGIVSLWASTIVRTVIAYEPGTENFQLLRKNIRINGVKNIQAHRLAISGKKGKKTLHLADTNAAGNSLLAAKRKATRSETITATTLDLEIKKHKLKSIDIIKMDCEGSEYEIVNSLSLAAWKMVKAFIIEYHEWPAIGHTREEIIKTLKQHNYKVRIMSELTPATGIIYAKK